MTDDNTAVAMVTEEDGVIYAKVFGFLPADKIEYKSNKEHVDYKKMIRNGYCYEMCIRDRRYSLRPLLKL